MDAPPRLDHRDMYIRENPEGPDLVFVDVNGNQVSVSCTDATLWRVQEMIGEYRHEIVAVDAWWRAPAGHIVYSVRERGGDAYATEIRPSLPLERFPRGDELAEIWKAAAAGGS
jgi:hypothetical protein